MSRHGPLALHGEVPVVGLGEQKLLVIAARRMLDLRSRSGKGSLALHGEMPVVSLGEQKLLVIAAGICHGRQCRVSASRGFERMEEGPLKLISSLSERIRSAGVRGGAGLSAARRGGRAKNEPSRTTRREKDESDSGPWTVSTKWKRQRYFWGETQCVRVCVQAPPGKSHTGTEEGHPRRADRRPKGWEY